MTPTDIPLSTPPNFVLCVDPGKTNGVSIFQDGKVASIDQVKIDDFPDFLAKFVAEHKDQEVVIIYETFKLFKGKAIQQSGSKMEASQVIGQLKLIAAQNKWRIIGQDPSIKTLAQMYSKVKPKGSHANSHHVDAYNHGVYWLVKNRMMEINTDA